MAKYERQDLHFYQYERYKNQTITEIHLLGFQSHHFVKAPLFSLLLLIYCTTILENILIIVLISTNKNLHSPMFFFLQHLSISDIILITNTVPVMLHIVINDGVTLSVAGCLTHFTIFSSLLAFECFLLTVMSYDRYLAICRPLHYSTVMDYKICITLVAFCWILGFTFTLTVSITLGTLHFCGKNIIDHFFCDPAPLLELSCSDTFLVKIEIFILAGPTGMFPSIFITVTYIFIALAIKKIKSNIGRQKAFSTCISHLAVVITFYGELIGMHVFPHRDQSTTMNKLLSSMYTVITPLLNPILYSIRSNDIKEALAKFIRRWKSTNTTNKIVVTY